MNVQKKFFFLLIIHNNLKWDSHIKKITSKILNMILYQNKCMVPSKIIYNALLNHI